ncbi:MAG: hypothetical protein JW818_15050 [Pirellulales bacterium]|nr:hypothetical protein [Pirellulales bacterium]
MKTYRAWAIALPLSLWACTQGACSPSEKPDSSSATAIRKVVEARKGQKNEKKETPAKGANQKQPSQYMRVTKDARGKLKALEIAIGRFAPADPAKRKDGPTVDLIGAVHVGEPSYYEKLNQEFKNYDVVLYELIAPEGSRPEPGMPSSNPISGLQNGLTSMLKLKHQLDGIDYHRPNLVHADMSPSELAESMRSRQENLVAMFARAMGYAIARESGDPMGGSNGQMMAALFAEDQALALRRAFAQQMADMGGLVQAMEGPKGSSIISQRNKKALEGLEKQLKAGKKKIAIFYGAGHMADMEKRLEKDFGLTRQSIRWLPAWKLDSRSEP